MPKTSAIERNLKRRRLVEKYKAKRAELKAILANPKIKKEDLLWHEDIEQIFRRSEVIFSPASLTTLSRRCISPMGALM